MDLGHLKRQSRHRQPVGPRDRAAGPPGAFAEARAEKVIVTDINAYLAKRHAAAIAAEGYTAHAGSHGDITKIGMSSA